MLRNVDDFFKVSEDIPQSQFIFQLQKSDKIWPQHLDLHVVSLPFNSDGFILFLNVLHVLKILTK